MTTEINTERTCEPVCPHCGKTVSEPWELYGEDGETECGWCEKPFRWARHTRITYTTKKEETR